MASSVGHSRFLVITSGLLICTIVVDPRNICNHDQHTVLSENGTFSYCRDCPPCHIGTGLTYECGSVINTEAEVKCVDCVDGSTFNDIDEGQSVVCKGCNREEHRVVRKPCTKTQDTQYADACEPGYYFVGETFPGPCRLCTCCKKNKLQQTCVEIGQGVPPDTKCQCPDVSVEPTNSTSASHNATVGPTEGPVTAHRTNTTGGITGPSEPVSSSSAVNPVKQEWKVYLGLALTIIAIVVIAIIVACLKGTGGTPYNSQGAARGLLQADTSDSCNTDEKEIHDQLDALTTRTSCQPRCSYTSSNPPCNKCYPNVTLNTGSAPGPNRCEINSEGTRNTRNHNQTDTTCDKCGNNKKNRDSMELKPLERISMPPCRKTCGQPSKDCHPHGQCNLIQENPSSSAIQKNTADCPLSEADFFLRSYLETKLDLAGLNHPQAGWHEVGKKFNVPCSHLNPLKLEYQRIGGSPTHGLFALLEARGSENEPSLEKFLKVLMELGHEDIINGWDWQANKEIEQ